MTHLGFGIWPQDSYTAKTTTAINNSLSGNGTSETSEAATTMAAQLTTSLANNAQNAIKKLGLPTTPPLASEGENYTSFMDYITFGLIDDGDFTEEPPITFDDFDGDDPDIKRFDNFAGDDLDALNNLDNSDS